MRSRKTLPARFLPILFTALLGLAGRPQAQVQKVSGDLGVHDPVLIKAGATYYAFGTGRGIPFKTSKDRVAWKNAGVVFPDKAMPAWHKQLVPDYDSSLWAPDIHYRDGLYHLYYSVSAWMNFNSAVGYATNTTLDPADPAYKWVDKGVAVSYKTPGNTGVNIIDPNAFVDADGKVWLVYGSYKSGLRILELNPATGLPARNPPEITALTKGLGEGVFLIKRNGWYYLFMSTGICCSGLNSTYQVGVARSRTVTGPYLNKAGGNLANGSGYTLLMAGDYEHPGQGHNGIFTDRDTTFMIYHAYTRSANGASLLTIRPIFLDKDGWITLDPAQAAPNVTGLAAPPSPDASRRAVKRVLGLPGLESGEQGSGERGSGERDAGAADAWLFSLEGKRLSDRGGIGKNRPVGLYLAAPARHSGVR